ncbi:MAG: hypothetical protein GXY33_19530 [Phycisphaerae bacterium]|nr:hypothetical protein [Phycisphaerae bacterium]
MDATRPEKALEQLARESGRYPVEAFHFIREALQFTVDRLYGQEITEQRHVTGRDLCWGIRDYAIQCWGLMAPSVLRRWNIARTEDFGRLVFTMVEAGWMAKSDEDTPEDFANIYDFRSAFATPLKLEEKKMKMT